MTVPVITGVGVISSVATGREAYWDALCQGRCGVGEVTLFDTSGYKGKLGAEVRDFRPEHYYSAREMRRLSRCDLLGGVALAEAVEDAGIDLAGLVPERIAVVIGSGSGGLLSAERFRRDHYHGRRPRPSLLVSFLSASFTDYVAWKIGARGLRSTISTACSSSSTAIGIAAEILRSGKADVVITGGTESLSETTFSGFNSLRAVDEIPCRPFDRERKGISLGEGAAIFVVEAQTSAAQRGRTPYAAIAGYGLSCDAHHVTAPSPDGSGIGLAIEAALRTASVGRDEVGYINAHGTGTQANDAAETKAFKRVFGERAYAIPVSSTKSMIGHCLGAAGAKEAAAALLPFVRGILPPTVNYRTPDPDCDLNYLPSPEQRNDVSVVLSTSVAFGGNNTALLLRRTV